MVMIKNVGNKKIKIGLGFEIWLIQEGLFLVRKNALNIRIKNWVQNSKKWVNIRIKFCLLKLGFNGKKTGEI